MQGTASALGAPAAAAAAPRARLRQRAAAAAPCMRAAPLAHAASPLLAPRRKRAAPLRLAARAEATQPSSAGGFASVAQPKWSVGTVVDNHPASADGSLRTLVISIQDEARRCGAAAARCSALRALFATAGEGFVRAADSGRLR